MLRTYKQIHRKVALCSPTRFLNKSVNEGIEISTRHDEKTVVLTIRNEGKMNCMTESIGKSFQSTIRNLSEVYPKARCLVLTGHGNSFSAGADLAWLGDRSRSSIEDNVETMKTYYGYMTPLLELNLPTIAAINGPAMGAGFCITMFCDVRITSDDSKLGANFVKVGISPGMGGSFTLPMKLNNQVMNDIILTGRTFSGREALEMGVVLKSFQARSMVLDESLSYAEQLINTTSPNAIRETLGLIRAPYVELMKKQLPLEAETQARCFASKEFKVALDCVKNKTVPVFD